MKEKPAVFLIATISCVLAFAISLGHQYINFRGFTLVLLLFAGVAVIAMPIRWAIRFFFVYLSFEGFSKIISNYHPAVHVGVDLLILALTAKVLILMVLGRLKQTEGFPPLSLLFFIHAGWFTISILNPNAINLVASLAGAKVYITMLLLFFFSYFLNKGNYREVKIIMGLWVATTLIQMGFAYYQSYIGPTSVTRIHPRYISLLQKYQGYAFRPPGLTAVPGMPAVFIFLSLPFLLYFIYSTRSILMKVGLTLIVPLWLVLQFICQIRSSLLKSIIVLSIFALFFFYHSFFQKSRNVVRNGLITAILSLGLIVSIPFLLSKIEASFPDASRAIERTMTLFDTEKVSKARRGLLDRFLDYATVVPFGAGLSRTGAASGRFKSDIESSDDPFGNVFFSDNFWIATVVDLGIPGMLVLTLIIGSILFRGFMYIKVIQPYNNRVLHLALFTGLFASAVGMYGAEAMLYNPEAAYFWYFAGAMIRIQRDQDIKSEAK